MLELRAVDEGAVPASAPATSRLFVLPVATRRWVLTDNKNSLSGALYFVTFIDDHSKKIFAYVLKNKYQVLDAFKEFHAKVERETSKKLKCIRSDNGEYRGPFEKYYRMYGIHHEKTVPKTPQQNGLAERMNRTLAERVTAMLSHAKLPNQFWA